jgi:hypothetical protein
MNFVIGIDPGLTGAIVVMDVDTGAPREIHDMPVHKLTPGSKKNQVDAKALAEILSPFHATPVALEMVSAMPRKDKRTGEEVSMGTASSFNFGAGWGIVLGVAAVCCAGVKPVVPTVWKRYWGLLKTEKDAARLLAIEKFPASEPALRRKKDSGRADALLIASWARNKLITEGALL